MVAKKEAPTKGRLESKVVWGAIAAVIVDNFASLFGVTLSEATQGVLSEQVALIGAAAWIIINRIYFTSVPSENLK